MSNRRVRLKYGRKEIETIAGRGREPRVLLPRRHEPASDSADLIRRALEKPIGSPPLREIVSRGDRVAVVASDITRSTASHVFLPIIVEKLNDAGIPDRDIDIVIALGIHRPQTEREHRSLLGDALYERIRPLDHDARDRAELVSYGKTSRGTEVAVNRRVAEADKVILTGAVGPHYYAGFGGGRKSIMPGVCSLEANLQSHLLVFEPEPARGRHAGARVARLAGNPVHEDMLEAAKMVGPHFMLNTVVGPEKDVGAAFAGDFVAAHETACAYYIHNFSVAVAEPADLTIVSCGGSPKDINFIQAHKAIHGAHPVTRPGGWMLVVAECGDGLGHPGFIDWFRFDNAAEFEEELRANYEIYGQTAYAAFEKATTVNIALVSELCSSDVERMRMRPSASFEQAYRMAIENLRKDFTTYIVPDASSTLLLTERERASALASIAGDIRRESGKVS